MIYPKFVALVQQYKAKDERERAEMTANREKLKASANKRKDDGGEGLNRQSKSKNQSNKRFKKNHNKNNQGDALYCGALCKAAMCTLVILCITKIKIQSLLFLKIWELSTRIPKEGQTHLGRYPTSLSKKPSAWLWDGILILSQVWDMTILSFVNYNVLSH